MRGFMSRIRLCFHILGPAIIGSLVALSASFAAAQVFTVAPEGLDAKYVDFQPTNVAISTVPLTTHNREDLLRFLQSEQGFTMRPLPISTITLKANGPMEPSGSEYLNLIREKGISAKAGERVVITDVKIEKDRILLDFNGGPEHKHKFLRHIQIGMDPNMTAPIVNDSDQAPTGSRIALVFPHAVPDMTGMQVEALIKPIVDFNLKSPVQAYADALPPWLRQKILEHQVLVGMNGDMVIAAVGQPRTKMRERENNVSFEEWIYGEPPEPVQFVRFNNNRVSRVEIAKVGESPEIRTENEMGDYWEKAPADHTRVVKLGDQAPTQPGAETGNHKAPSLRLPGETLPADSNPSTPQMGPVQFPKDQDKNQSPNSGQQQGSPPPSGQPAPAPAQPAPPPSGTPLVASGGGGL